MWGDSSVKGAGGLWVSRACLGTRDHCGTQGFEQICSQTDTTFPGGFKNYMKRMLSVKGEIVFAAVVELLSPV